MQIIPREKKRKERWILRDDFLDTVLAGSVDGTQATPTGGARTASDLNTKISIGSGVADFATGSQVNTSSIRWNVPAIRSVGRSGFAKINTTALTSFYFGFDNNGIGPPTDGMSLTSSNGNINAVANTASLVVGVFNIGSSIALCVIERLNGHFYFVKGGTLFPIWTLVYRSITGTAGVQPVLYVGAGTNTCTADFVRVPLNIIDITPTASDAFTRADGLLGLTGGGGSEEDGGTGLVWTAQLGSWGVTSNAARPAGLSGGKAIATVEADSPNLLLEATIPVHAALNAGVVLRYVDVDNHVYAVITQSGFAYLIKRAAGVDTTLANVAITEDPAKRLVISADGTKFRLYYAEALIGAEQTIADAGLQNSRSCGVYSTSTGNSIDDFVVWARGSGGEYSFLDKYTGA